MVKLEPKNYIGHSWHKDLFLLNIKSVLASLSKRLHEAIWFWFNNIWKCGFFIFFGKFHPSIYKILFLVAYEFVKFKNGMFNGNLNLRLWDAYNKS